jgi:chitodextrinase
LSGDATLANGGELTISDDAITTNKLQDASVTDAKLDKTNIPLSGFGVAAADVDMGSNKLKNLTDPTEAQDAVTKTYVDAISPSPGVNLGDMLYWDGSSWVSIEATQNEGATFQMIGGVPQWVGGTPPPEVPDAPTITSVSAGEGQVDIIFDAPTNDGGSTITTYTATSSPGNITGSISQAGSGTITVTGLSNGTAYTFTVTATNAVGTSSPSSASNSVTLPAEPDAPTITSVSVGDEQVFINFEAPTDDGGSPIQIYTARGSSPRGTIYYGFLAQAGSGTIRVGNLSNGTAYTFTVTATNAVGTSSPSSASNSVTPSSPQVGDFRDGGVVFYVVPTPTDLDGDGTLDQGLVCAVDDQSSNAGWGCYGTSISGADGNGIGSGADNTSDILADCSQSGIAAELCDNYTGGGYSDWFLPSKDELNRMYQNKATIDATAGANAGSGFASDYYWSSTENNFNVAWIQFFYNGSQYTNNKNYSSRVRAVRAF